MALEGRDSTRIGRNAVESLLVRGHHDRDPPGMDHWQGSRVPHRPRVPHGPHEPGRSRTGAADRAGDSPNGVDADAGHGTTPAGAGVV